MRFDVLGPLRVIDTDGPIKVPSGGTTRVVCWLVANLGRPVAPAALAAVLWPAAPAGGAAKAGTLVRRLVPLLGAEVLRVDGAATLLAEAADVDARRFEELVTSGLAALTARDPEAATLYLRAALDLWRGDPYPELERAFLAIPVIDRLVELRLSALEELNGLALRGRVEYPFVAELRALVIRHPERPRLHTQLALALYRTGRQIEALEVVARARAEQDAPSLSMLQTAILQQAPELADGEFDRT